MTAQAPLSEPEPADEGSGVGGVVVPLAGRRSRPGDRVRPAAYQTDGNLALKQATPGVPTPSSSFDAATGAARSAVIVARALLEVLSGWRPASQLSRVTSYPLQQDLERRAPRRPTGSRQQLLRVKVSEPADGIAEVCALTHDLSRNRVRVMALRMERREGEWIVTRLQAG